MTIYLVRHASAGGRGAHGDDLTRPLDEIGHDRAEAIGARLATAGVQRILSSAAVRCVQTVDPLARRLALDVAIEPALMEGQPATAALALIDDLASQGVTAVLCSHGDIIPSALQTLDAMGVTLHGSRCPKGSIWEVAVTDGEISSATYQAPTHG